MREKFLMFKEYVMKSFDLESKNSRLAINVVIILLLNIAAAAFSLRIDLTANGTYSLSKRSRETVSSLDEKLKIKVLFSKDLPAEHAAVFRYLKDILEEYDFYGSGSFSYEIVEEEKLESQAADYGIKPVQSREFVSDQVKLRNVYMGVVIQHADLIEKIDSLTSTSGLEYEITSRIEKMTGKVDRLLKMKNPVVVTLFLDERVRDLPIDGIGKLEDMVKNSVAKSNIRNYNKIQFQTIDPSNGGDKDIDKKFGISKLRWGNVQTRSGKMIAAGEAAFGLVIEGGGRFIKFDMDVMPTILGTNVISGLDNLEDKINNAVGDLLSPSTRIGYVKGHGIPEINDKRSPEGAGLLSEVLSDMYELAEIDLAAQDIPADIRVMIINGASDQFSETEKYKIDQFLMAGKSVICFANSFKEINMQGEMNMMGNQPIVLPVSSGFEEMSLNYGIKINKNVVLDKNCTKVNLGEMVTDYPLMPMIQKKKMNRESVITKHLNSALFIKTSSLEPVEKMKERGVDTAVLISTSDESWIMEGKVNFNPFFMNPKPDEQFKSYPVAVLASGKFQSFFMNKEIPKEIKEKEGRGNLTSVRKLDSTVDSGKSQLIVVGSSEFTSSGFLSHARRILSGGGNSNTFSDEILVHGMVDYLAGNEYVPEMKGKSLDFNPLKKTEDNTRFMLKVINMGLVPVAVVLTGFIVWRRRISRRRAIEAAFSGGDR